MHPDQFKAGGGGQDNTASTQWEADGDKGILCEWMTGT